MEYVLQGISLFVIVLIFIKVLEKKNRLGGHSSPDPPSEDAENFEVFALEPRSHSSVQPYILRIPPQPPEGYSKPKRGRGGWDDSYETDLASMTCTCEDFLLRKRHVEGSFSRCCKHLMHHLNAFHVFDEEYKWEEAISSEGYGAPISACLIELGSAPTVLVAMTDNETWVNVFAHSKRKGERIHNASGRIHRFGWNVEQDRWSYVEGPGGSRELTPIMRELF